MRQIALADLRQLLREPGAAQIVEVLATEEYEWAHIPGALHLPLKGLDAYSAGALDTGRPVVAYCNDFL